MKDFSKFMPTSHNDRILNSGRFVFEKQLQGLEACDLIIEGVKERGIIYNHLNDLSEGKEFRALNVRENVRINKGSYVTYDNEQYMTVTDVDNHFFYKSCKISKCNQVLKWIGCDMKEPLEFPCIISNDSYGAKTLANNDMLTMLDTKMKIEVQQNECTKKLRRDMRFIFNKSEYDIFKCVDITTSINSGTMILTCQKDIKVNEDDLENNLAYNSSSNTEEPPLTNYKIVGNPQIRVGTTQRYLVDTTGVISWTLDGSNTCSLKVIDNNECDVTALVKDELNVLTAIKDRVVIAKLNIETMR